jgi:hypothetical protein
VTLTQPRVKLVKRPECFLRFKVANQASPVARTLGIASRHADTVAIGNSSLGLQQQAALDAKRREEARQEQQWALRPAANHPPAKRFERC